LVIIGDDGDDDDDDDELGKLVGRERNQFKKRKMAYVCSLEGKGSISFPSSLLLFCSPSTFFLLLIFKELKRIVCTLMIMMINRY